MCGVSVALTPPSEGDGAKRHRLIWGTPHVGNFINQNSLLFPMRCRYFGEINLASESPRLAWVGLCRTVSREPSWQGRAEKNPYHAIKVAAFSIFWRVCHACLMLRRVAGLIE
jgi:hypothetical protein